MITLIYNCKSYAVNAKGAKNATAIVKTLNTSIIRSSNEIKRT